VVCHEIINNGWEKVALLGTKWTMNGPVYEKALSRRSLERMIPDDATQEFIHASIFDELCISVFNPGTVDGYTTAIDKMKDNGAECVILGCTEIPLIINETNSSLPVLDSTRLLAKYAVKVAMGNDKLPSLGWIA
jgi:aspartate racemase